MSGLSEPSSAESRDSPNKRCSRCGTRFFCAGGDGRANCWCDALPHVGFIAGPEHDCLCPACLRAAIARTERPGRGDSGHAR